MEKKNFIPIPNLSLLTKYSNTNTKTSPISLRIPSPINSTTSLLDHLISNKFYSENIVITQPTVKYIKIKYDIFIVNFI